MQQVSIRSNRDQDHTLVVVFLRGGADGLTLVPPIEDDAYHRARPTLRVSKSEAIPLDGFFGLHPRLAPLKTPYDNGDLAIVHGAGSEDTTRSHFEAQDFMEHGGNAGGGWLGRYLRHGDHIGAGPLSAIAIGRTQPEALRSAPASVTFESVDTFSLNAPAPFMTALDGLYALEKDALGSSGRDALVALEKLHAMQAKDYHPENGATYPDDRFGHGLLQIARLIKTKVGVDAAALDLDGWDAHFASAALMNPLMDRLGRGLAAFYTDMGEAMNRVTLVVLTEFGRRVRENVSFGTDHGRGGVMFVMGGGVQGGRVVSDWRGLSSEYLEGPGDLPVSFNYRDVLAPILERIGGVSDMAQVFPNYTFKPVNLYV